MISLSDRLELARRENMLDYLNVDIQEQEKTCTKELGMVYTLGMERMDTVEWTDDEELVMSGKLVLVLLDKQGVLMAYILELDWMDDRYILVFVDTWEVDLLWDI